ncbi:SIS domain-containing protein [Seongchinamella sediminis]|nr:SIS domain-containing protein [Seongchinamella sediminis]
MEAVAMSVDQLAEPIARGSEMMTQVLLNDGKIFCCGLGLDAALAQLFCSLLLENPARERPALPAFNLGPGAALQEDAAGHALARQVRALAADSDLLLVIDSGPERSACAGALHAAREKGMPVVAMGNALNGSLAAALNAGDVHIAVEARQRGQCVELHTMVALGLCQLIETSLFGDYHQE